MLTARTISLPFDTARNALIHFHCTSATKMDGPAGDRLPFIMRTQTDSGRGVSLDVENRKGQAVTCAKFINLDTMLDVLTAGAANSWALENLGRIGGITVDINMVINHYSADHLLENVELFVNRSAL